MSDSEDGFQWEVIHTYSRKQALDEGRGNPARLPLTGASPRMEIAL